ncbi:MAG TPA: alpha/beta hydrolase [Mycobacterium sp.]|uniref:alpha/beta hydrolase n=1 Tax=Mycolicibacterium sp. TaxID=2320850 RepID=UPI0025D345A0|nr:alpha/beta hydrolase [Mycolicibacterium sp.]HPX35108.1 alpha/beta hydrolase [Mycobacterium sp.]HQC75522.1 alpha/beta hydrolase [Mycobacterium sp.]
MTVKDRALAVANRLGVKLIPRLPAPAKRLMSGGKAITLDGNTLDPSIQMMLAAQKVMGINGLVVAGDAIATRRNNGELTASLDQPNVRVAQTRDLSIPGPAGPIGARHYTPHGTERAPLVVFFHGGGFVFGDLDTHDAACRLISRDAGVQVLAIDYRLAPEHPAPAAVDDCLAAYRWAVAQAEELGADPNRIAVAGDSAGGCLAAVVSRLARDAGDPLPALQWLIYPVTDMRGGTRSRSLFADGFLLTKADMDWFQDSYLQGSEMDESHPLVSPLLAEDLTGLPPALVTTAGFDPLRDEGEQYAAKLQEAGVKVDLRRAPGMTHAFINLNVLGGGVAAANAQMISALRAHLSR